MSSIVIDLDDVRYIIDQYFFKSDFSRSAIWNSKNGSVMLSSSHDEFNSNMLAMKRAGYIFHRSVDRNAYTLITLKHLTHPHPDVLAASIKLPNKIGASIILKKGCMVCGNRAFSKCSTCRAVHYCSTTCQQEDLDGHQQWCCTPKAVDDFQDGINKVRRAIWTRKYFYALEKNWMTPRPDGSCGYAEWSWRKMQKECEFA